MDDGTALPSSLEESEEALLEGDTRFTRFAPGTARAALSHAVFRRLFIGAWLSNVGSWMQQIVLVAYAYDRTSSSTFVGLLTFAQLGPTLLLGLVGGMVADMVDRRKLLVVVTAFQGAFALALAAVVASDDPSRLWIFLTALGCGVFNALFAPAYSALLPGLVGKEDLPGAISLNSTQMNASRVVGPAIGGIAFATVGASWVFIGNAVSFLFVIGALLSVTLPVMATSEPEPIGRRFTGGIRAARRDPIVGRSLVTITVFSFFSIVYVGMMPVLAVENLGIDDESIGYGVFYACFGFGAVVGSILNGTLLHHVSKPLIVRWGLLAYAGIVTVFALLRSPVPAYPIVIVVGATYFGMVTALNTVMQERLEEHERGRVMALWLMGFGGTVALANVAFGPIVDAIGLTPVMLLGAAVAVGLARYADLRAPAPAEPLPTPALAD